MSIRMLACWPGSTPIRGRSIGGMATRRRPLREAVASSFSWDIPSRESTTTSSPPLPKDEALLIKGAQSGHLCAIDPNRMKMLWDRPIAKSSRLLGADDQCVYLGGPELSAMDLKTRQLSWVTRLPNGSAEARVLVRPDALWQMTPRGVFEIDPKSGDVRRIFRGVDLGAAGGDLFLTDQLLISVSNRAISAYPRTTPSTLTMTRASND